MAKTTYVKPLATGMGADKRMQASDARRKAFFRSKPMKLSKYRSL